MAQTPVVSPTRLSRRVAELAPSSTAAAGKAAKELGWKPKYTELEAIVRTAWEWHRAHPDGYADRPAR